MHMEKNIHEVVNIWFHGKEGKKGERDISKNNTKVL